MQSTIENRNSISFVKGKSDLIFMISYFQAKWDKVYFYHNINWINKHENAHRREKERGKKKRVLYDLRWPLRYRKERERDISIHTNFHQNRSIQKVLEWFWHKSGLLWHWITFEVKLQVIKNLRLHDVDILSFK